MCVFLNPLISQTKNNNNNNIIIISFLPFHKHFQSMAHQLSRRTLTLIKKNTLKFSTTTKARLIEVDLESSSTTTTEEVMGLKKLEDAIHSIMVRRLAPDWLPFRPGSSYWVPPKPSSCSNNSIVDIVDKLTNPLTPEQSLSLSSSRGWPSSSFFCGESISEPVIPVEVVEVHVIVPSQSEKTFTSEDED